MPVRYSLLPEGNACGRRIGQSDKVELIARIDPPEHLRRSRYRAQGADGALAPDLGREVALRAGREQGDRVAGANGARAADLVDDEPLRLAGQGGAGIDPPPSPRFHREVEAIVGLESHRV